MRENAAITQPRDDQPSPSSSADPSLGRHLSPRLLDHFASLIIAICAVICGADGWTEIEA
jgi:hypothetical protein